MELFRETNIDFLSKKWYFLAFSLIFSLAGLTSMAVRYHKTGSPVPLGIDFRGGTVVDVKFSQKPNRGYDSPRSGSGRTEERHPPGPHWQQ